MKCCLSKAQPRLARALGVSLFVALCLHGATEASGQTGVSDDRVNLPDGPGSLEGLGENVDTGANMGQLSLQYPIIVPRGFPGVTPELALRYDSGSGASEVGMGWSLAIPSIERATVRGLPRYDDADRFVADGATELVEVPGSDPAEYRARFEGSFIRYFWMSRGDGNEGYWRALLPDGTVRFYGADSSGSLDERARVSGPDGTFRYLLSEVVDAHGHRLEFRYDRFGNYALITELAYLFRGDEAQASITFQYSADGERSDLVSDCKPGFCEVLEHRLNRINVFAGGTRYLYYDLRYEDDDVSGGFSRLQAVERYGVEGDGTGTPHPFVPTYTYSDASGATCDGFGCAEPRLVSFETGVGVSLSAGNASLIDINGDALPDLVDTSREGAHRFFINALSADGALSFLAPVDSAIGDASDHRLSDGHVQLLDVDGDGFTDMVNAFTGSVLQNLGGGSDWAGRYDLGSVESVARLDFELGDDGEPTDIRFLDYDNDRYVDVIRSLPDATQIYRSVGDGGFVVDENVEDIGWGFGADRLELEDVNGDGLPDPVRVVSGAIQYRLNLGFGRWDEVREIDGLPISSDDLPFTELEDINGDALVDVIVLRGGQVDYFLNRNGSSFDPVQSITSAAGGNVPSLSERTVLYADMNANGTTDIVWFDSLGEVVFLEIFPERPNLMTRYDNGAGLATEVTYQSSAESSAAAGGAAAYPLPYPMTVVSAVEVFDAITGWRETTTTQYADPFYDGVEARFRGFASAVRESGGNEYVEAMRIVETFDVGLEAPQMAGRLLSRATYSDDRLLREERFAFDQDCGVDALGESVAGPSVVFACLRRSDVDHVEGGTADAVVTTSERFEYDVWGNITARLADGITSVGSGACAACDETDAGPCGDRCIGDEVHETTTYVLGDDSAAVWRTDLRQTLTVDDASASGLVVSTSYYYDGAPFEGLDAGSYDIGDRTRVSVNVGDRAIDVERNRFDTHGNIVEQLTPIADAAGRGDRRRYTYDVDGVEVVEIAIPVVPSQGDEYTLRRTFAYDEIFGLPTEISRWFFDATAPVETRTYDVHGRLASITLPGHSAPSREFAWGFEDGVLVTHERARTDNAADLDLHKVTCFDGRQRPLQTRTKVGATYSVDGFTERDQYGSVVRTFIGYEGPDAVCDTSPPSSAAVTREFDALGRETVRALPDAEIYGTSSTRRSVYRPLAVDVFDELDTDSESEHADTPMTTVRDGQDRIVSIARRPDASAEPWTDHFAYDTLSNITRHVDALGNIRTQEFDELGRLVRDDDPNSGARAFVYDASGNLVRAEDARGIALVSEYDDLGRVVARWDAADPEAARWDFVYDRSADCPGQGCTYGAGRQVGAFDSDGNGEWRGFDERGNATWFARDLDGHLFETFSSYDDADRLVGRVFPGAGELSMGRDGLGRVTSIADALSAVAYDARGFVAGLAYDNGVELWRDTDDRGRLNGAYFGSGAWGFELDRDRSGNITRVVDVSPLEGTPSMNALHTYDALNRLSASVFDEGRAGEETISYTHDAIGRVTSQTSSSVGGQNDLGAFLYDSGSVHAVTSAGEASREYNASGHMTRRGQDTQGWDALGRLSSVTRGEELRAAYAYDGARLRTVAREGTRTTYYISRDFRVANGIGVTTARLGRDPVAEFFDPGLAVEVLGDFAPADLGSEQTTPYGDGRVTAADAWMVHAASEGLVPTLEVRGDAASLLASSVHARVLGGERVSYLHTDHLGSVVAETDTDGAMVAQVLYSAHGTTRHTTRPGWSTWGVSGARADEMGLVYFGLRYLDPELGRWTEPDPVFGVLTPASLSTPEQATERYAFVRNNGATYFDPDGGLVARVARRLFQVAQNSQAGRRFRNGVIGGVGSTVTGFNNGRTWQGNFERGFRTGVQDGVVGNLGLFATNLGQSATSTNSNSTTYSYLRGYNLYRYTAPQPSGLN